MIVDGERVARERALSCGCHGRGERGVGASRPEEVEGGQKTEEGRGYVQQVTKGDEEPHRGAY